MEKKISVNPPTSVVSGMKQDADYLNKKKKKLGYEKCLDRNNKLKMRLLVKP
jgi:hypothetical protein